jgi:phosphomannomutase
MNRKVVLQTTAGFAAYLWERHRGSERDADAIPPSCVVGFDARELSEVFAEDVASVLAGAGITVTLLAGPCPTPLLAFAVRHLDVCAGVMITASHNPPRDNGWTLVSMMNAPGSQGLGPQAPLEFVWQAAWPQLGSGSVATSPARPPQSDSSEKGRP